MHFQALTRYNSSCCNYILSTPWKRCLQKVDSFEFSSKFLKNPILYRRPYIVFIVFTYRKIALCHTAYVLTGRWNAKNFASLWSQNLTLIVKLTNFWFEFFNKVGIFMIGKDQIYRKCKKPDIEIFIAYTL